MNGYPESPMSGDAPIVNPSIGIKPPKIDLTGKRFKKLVVIKFYGRKDGQVEWLCVCDCGKEKAINGYNLLRGRSSSCGCNQGGPRVLNKRNGTKEYRTWKHIRDRCSRPKCKQYSRYGGRGISVCERWNDYEIFLADMGRAPTPKHEIERIDNDGNYEPGNCKWATRVEQMNNMSRNHHIHVFGETKNLSEWCMIYNQAINTVLNRLNRGWKAERALLERPSLNNYRAVERRKLLRAE